MQIRDGYLYALAESDYGNMPFTQLFKINTTDGNLVWNNDIPGFAYKCMYILSGERSLILYHAHFEVSPPNPADCSLLKGYNADGSEFLSLSFWDINVMPYVFTVEESTQKIYFCYPSTTTDDGGEIIPSTNIRIFDMNSMQFESNDIIIPNQKDVAKIIVSNGIVFLGGYWRTAYNLTSGLIYNITNSYNVRDAFVDASNKLWTVGCVVQQSLARFHVFNPDGSVLGEVLSGGNQYCDKLAVSNQGKAFFAFRTMNYGMYLYYWFNGGHFFDNGLSENYTIPVAGVYCSPNGSAIYFSWTNQNNQMTIYKYGNETDDGGSGDNVKITNNSVIVSNSKISFTLRNSDVVKITIYDILGRVVFSSEKNYNSGTNYEMFNKLNLASGIYICKIQSKEINYVNKIALIK